MRDYLLTIGTLAILNLTCYVLLLRYGYCVIRLHKSYRETVAKLSDLTMDVLKDNTRALLDSAKGYDVLQDEIGELAQEVESIRDMVRVLVQHQARAIPLNKATNTLIMKCTDRLAEVKDVLEQTNRHHLVLRNLQTIGKSKKR